MTIPTHPRITLLLSLIYLLISSPLAIAEKINIAVASNFSQPMKEIVAIYQENNDLKIALSFGSSGKIYAQIIHGAPYHLFFSADQEKTQALIQGELAIAGSDFTYAEGVLVLWSNNSPFGQDLSSKLKDQSFRKIALANPKLAPYGRAAAEVLDSLHLSESTKAKWVIGENIAQTYQFVSTGNVDLGFVALSQLRGKTKTENRSIWIVPRSLHRPILQDAVLLKHGETNVSAKDFLVFMQSDDVGNILEKYGYQLHHTREDN